MPAWKTALPTSSLSSPVKVNGVSVSMMRMCTRYQSHRFGFASGAAIILLARSLVRILDMCCFNIKLTLPGAPQSSPPGVACISLEGQSHHRQLGPPKRRRLRDTSRHPAGQQTINQRNDSLGEQRKKHSNTRVHRLQSAVVIQVL